MAKQFTHKCIVCGTGYNSCFRGKNIDSWRNIYCSVQCFQKHMDDSEEKPIGVVRDEIKKLQEKFPLVANDTGEAPVRNTRQRAKK